MLCYVTYSILVLVTSSVTCSSAAASCDFQDIELLNHTASCYGRQPIPDHFPSNLSTLFIGISYDNESDAYPDCTGSGPLSYLPADQKPISGLANFRWIQFCKFNFNDGRVERINPYLEHVKSTLVTLEIVHGKLTRLNAGVLRGFTNLKELTIASTGLEHIEPGAFSEISFNGPALVNGALNLAGNRLKHFDWSLLKPMTLGLQVIILRDNAMESMELSESLVFPNLSTADLNNNNLRTIPTGVIKSWPRNVFSLNAMGNPFCPTDSLCRCCSVWSLWYDLASQGINLGMSCGPDYRNVSKCPNTGNSTSVKSRSTCSAGCNILTTEMIDFAEYDSCTSKADPHSMACDIKRPAKSPNGRTKKQQRTKRVRCN